MRVYVAAPAEKFRETCDEAKKAFGENTEVLGETHGSIEMVKAMVDHIITAEIVLMGRGWRTSRECRVAHMLAQEYGVPMRCVI